MPQEKDNLDRAHRAALALQSEIHHPTVSRLYDDQIKLLQDAKDAWDEYQRLVVRFRLHAEP
jgi:hypothetical protein